MNRASTPAKKIVVAVAGCVGLCALSLPLAAAIPVLPQEPTPTASSAAQQPAVPAVAFPLRLSANRRYLVDRNNQPFLYVADTSWTLLSYLSVDDAKRVIDTRRSQGFNTIQTILTPFSIDASGPRGTPFTGTDLTAPNESYWAGVDEIMKYAHQQGMLLYVVPLWMASNGGWGCEDGGCVPAPAVEKMTAYMTWVGQRYRNLPNLVWVMGGDDEMDRNREVKVAGARALRAVDPDHLMTYHPRAMEFGLSSEPWHDFNAFQKNDITGPFNYEQIRQAWQSREIKPILQAEPPYEPTTAMQQGEVVTPRLNRRFGWWAALSGAMGVTYGGPSGSWKIGKVPVDWTAIQRPQATQTANIGRILGPLPWYWLVPDWDGAVVTSGRGTYGQEDYATAARGADGSMVVAFAPSARTFTVDLSALRSPGKAQWYDPVSAAPVGAPIDVGNTGTRDFATPGPNSGGDDDWVLVLLAGDAPVIPRPVPNPMTTPTPSVGATESSPGNSPGG